MTKKEKKVKEDKEKDAFNQGRLAGDSKWIDAIDERIKELEISVGIPELKRLKEKTKYRWR